MYQPPLRGLVAATTTPLAEDGSIKLGEIGPTMDRLLASGVRGFYVCGSTGEGMSLTSEERRAVVEETVRCVDGRAPVIVQVGHNSLAEANRLAVHAESVGADVISATCPSYFKVADAEALCQCMQQISSGIELPFYYYHIPALTGSPINIVQFMDLAVDRIPTLAGLKYTAPMLHDYQSCLHAGGGRYDLEGDNYIEHIDYCSFPNYEGISIAFKLSFENGVLTQQGTYPLVKLGLGEVDGYLVETYEKI